MCDVTAAKGVPGPFLDQFLSIDRVLRALEQLVARTVVDLLCATRRIQAEGLSRHRLLWLWLGLVTRLWRRGWEANPHVLCQRTTMSQTHQRRQCSVVGDELQ